FGTQSHILSIVLPVSKATVPRRSDRESPAASPPGSAHPKKSRPPRGTPRHCPNVLPTWDLRKVSPRASKPSHRVNSDDRTALSRLIVSIDKSLYLLYNQCVAD